MKLKLRKFLILSGTAIFTMVIWSLIAVAERRRLSPPPAVNTLAEFADAMPSPRRLVIVEEAGEKRVVWIGESGHWSLPSGPACYVFDGFGRLVEWNSETGDGQPTTRFLQPAWNAKQLTVKEAIESIRD